MKEIVIGTRVLVPAFNNQLWGTVTDIEEELEEENYSDLGNNWMKYYVELDDSEKLGQEEFWYSMNEIILVEI